MKKILLLILLGIVIVVAGFFVYQNSKTKNQTAPAISVSPVFSNLSAWLPNVLWSDPQPTTEDTPYGTLSGMKVEGKITGSNRTGGKTNYQDQPFMENMGFVKDINFAADGPGASNWGYNKTENGKMQVVIFRYSSNRLLGPESTEPPYMNFSVFVSDPFVKK